MAILVQICENAGLAMTLQMPNISGFKTLSKRIAQLTIKLLRGIIKVV